MQRNLFRTCKEGDIEREGERKTRRDGAELVQERKKKTYVLSCIYVLLKYKHIYCTESLKLGGR